MGPDEGNGTMINAVGTVADRFLNRLLPKATAGACPCGDSYYQVCYCAAGRLIARFCRTNCDCSVTTCEVSCHYILGGC
jgi:hypothetical protein